MRRYRPGEVGDAVRNDQNFFRFTTGDRKERRQVETFRGVVEHTSLFVMPIDRLIAGAIIGVI
jgi:hypothetical protein